jgi:predicted ester cyclase
VTAAPTPRDLALDLSRAIMRADWEAVDRLLAPSFVYLADGRPPMDKAAYVAFMRDVLCSAMTNMDMQFLRVVAEGDMVAVDYSNTMTHSGTFLGRPATGRRVVATGQFMRQVKGQQVVAEWQTTNAVGLMAQLGDAR